MFWFVFIIFILSSFFLSSLFHSLHFIVFNFISLFYRFFSFVSFLGRLQDCVQIDIFYFKRNFSIFLSQHKTHNSLYNFTLGGASFGATLYITSMDFNIELNDTTSADFFALSQKIHKSVCHFVNRSKNDDIQS